MKNKTSNLEKACLHTITTRPWSLEEAIQKYAESGIAGISVWRNYLDPIPIHVASKMLNDSGLEIISLVRGGFFTGLEKSARDKAIDQNKQMIEEADAIRASSLVLVCGSTPGQSLECSRDQIYQGIDAILPVAEKHKIRLAVEPLHPVYSDTRSAINTLRSANDLVENFKSPWLGLALDVYHLWWDPSLKNEIQRCGKNNHIFAVHLSDWRVPTRDILNDRELMGKGIIDIQEFINWVKEAGYSGMYEVEIFSDSYWSMNQDKFLHMIIDSLQSYSF